MFIWKAIWDTETHYSKKKAAILIVISIITTCVLGFLIIFGYHSLQQQQAMEKAACIQKIVQASPRFKALETVFFAEILGLSVDQAIPFYSFDVQEAEKRLLETWLFKEVCVKKIKPHTLFINYTLRQPMAYSGDYANTAMDGEGKLFPFFPFFSAQKMPKIYLGSFDASKNIWGSNISESHLCIINDLLTYFPKDLVKKIDLSAMEVPSLGKRQLVVVLSRAHGQHTLRLSVKNYSDEIKNYFILLKEVLRTERRPCIIDLRLPQVAYLSFGD